MGHTASRGHWQRQASLGEHAVCTGSQWPKEPAGDIPLTGKPPATLLQRPVHGRPLWLFASGRYQGLAGAGTAAEGWRLIVQPSIMLLLVKFDASHRCLSALPTAHLWGPASCWRAEAGECLAW